MAKIKQNALSQKMGDIYHYYIAIKLMLDNNSWNKCIIEQYGDIVLLDENEKQIYNIEVKHHIEEQELKIYNEEFQKTLSNWFDIRDLFNIKNLFNADTKLILMTSSIVSKDNPLNYWNTFTPEKKYKTLLDNQKQKNGKYYSSVGKYFHQINKNINELKEVLQKVEIQHSLTNILEIKNEIKSLNYFRIFKNNEIKKNKTIDELYGLVGRGLENKNQWEITKNQFDQKLIESTKLIQETILRTDNSLYKDEIDTDIENYKDKQFIQKLDNIEFGENIFRLAIDDYSKSIIEMSERMDLSSSLEYDERLKSYDESLIRLVNEIKTEYEYSNLTDIKKSQQSYFQIMKSNKVPFMLEEFNDRTTFFQKGYLHILAGDEVEPQKICWSLKPEDLI